MADHSEENVPLLNANVSAGGDQMYDGSSTTSTGQVIVQGGEEDPPTQQYTEEGDENNQRFVSGSSVNCRVCDAVIQLEGRAMQHVVKCGACQEATPIRPAPPGKKYVRCPCNCLLICKASSTRIACPRQNCRRVITLGQQSSPGTAMQAPTGTCRVTCAYCDDIFMFNTLSNTLATCPHCRKRSSVGTAHRRSKIYTFLVLFLLSLVAAIIFSYLLVGGGHAITAWLGLISLVIVGWGAAVFSAYKTFIYSSVRVSTIVSPV